MPKKLSLDEFINKANTIHKNKYGYSKFIYKNAKTNGIIICPNHGEFLQTPDSHLHRKGCRLCGINRSNLSKQSNTNEFINKSIIIHGNKYDYSVTNYIKNNIKTKIICKKHGEFIQMPHSHLEVEGCPRCGNEIISDRLKMTLDMFIKKANLIHNNVYSYNETIYKKSDEKIKIGCKIHGIFTQNPAAHLMGQGCPKCAGLYKTTENCIEEFNTIHKFLYDYSKVKYLGALNKVKIICKKHGEFEQTPANHLCGKGCSKCCNNISKQEISFLNYIGVSERNIKIKEWKRKPVDGYDPKTNTIYEFLGDYWHGNPVKFKSTNLNNHTKKTFGELYEKTFFNLNRLKSFGYTVKYIWENDWDRFKKGIDQIPNIKTYER
jgi:hypothetical protein